jgi:xylulose-5-phosphate/fructose-6-phosphate phosphoketolase
VDKPVIFAFHGYPQLIHRLTYRRHGHDNIHVRGYKEEGTTTTPFDMTVLNSMDRFQLAFDAIRRIERLHSIVERERDRLEDSHQRHKAFVMQYGEDMPEIQNWKWSR